MILTLTRDNTATKGLIVAQTDESNLTSLRCYKPTELEELSLIELTDGSIEVSIKIGQKAYNVTTDGVSGLVINGVDQVGQTAAQISDTLSLLFLESTGGGGGTPDNTTPPYLPFKSVSNTFEDSTLFHSIEPAVDEFALDGGKEEVSFQIKNDNVNGIKKMKFGNTQPVVSPYDHVYFEIDFLALFITMVCDEILLGGDVATGAAHIKTEQTNKVVKLGDIFNNNAGSKIVIDDVSGIISLQPNNGTDIFADIDAGNQKIELRSQGIGYHYLIIDNINQNAILSCNKAGIKLDVIGETSIGDIHAIQNNTVVIVNDTDKRVLNSSANGKYNFANIQSFATNAAAIVGGLIVGDIYINTSYTPVALSIVI